MRVLVSFVQKCQSWFDRNQRNLRFAEKLRERLRNGLVVKAHFGRISKTILLSFALCSCKYNLSTLSKLVELSCINSEGRHFLAISWC